MVWLISLLLVSGISNCVSNEDDDYSVPSWVEYSEEEHRLQQIAKERKKIEEAKLIAELEQEYLDQLGPSTTEYSYTSAQKWLLYTIPQSKHEEAAKKVERTKQAERAEEEMVKKEKAEKEKVHTEMVHTERVHTERVHTEKVHTEHGQKERAEKEKAGKKRAEQEKAEKSKSEREKMGYKERPNKSKIEEKKDNTEKLAESTTRVAKQGERKIEETTNAERGHASSAHKWWENTPTEEPTTQRSVRHNVSIAKAVLEFKIVPDILNYAPQHGIQIIYGSNTTVYYGNFLPEEDLKSEPETLFWTAKASRYYTLLLSGPDMPSRQYPFQREWLHWLVGNVRGNIWGTGDVLAKYMAPFSGRDVRRLVFLVFEQTDKIDYETKLFAQEERETSYQKPTLLRPLFSTRDFMNQMKLSNPVAINFFQIRANLVL